MPAGSLRTARRGAAVPPRSGFSLMELFLVITILSVISLLTFPLLRRPLNASVVQDAGQQLMRELAAARTQAIESGRPLLFQYQPSTGRYYLGDVDQRRVSGANFPETDGDTDWQVEGVASAERGTRGRGRKSGRDSDPAAESELTWSQAGVRVLPGDVVFAESAPRPETSPPPSRKPSQAGEKSSGNRRGPGRRNDTTSAADETQDGRDVRRSADPPAWSTPIRFYPSGRIKPAKLLLTHSTGAQAEFVVHGLAGRFQLSPLRK